VTAWASAPSSRACLATERRVGEHARGPRDVVGDEALDLVDGAALADGALEHPHLLRAEIGVAEQFVEQAALSGGEAFARDRDEDGALALAQVVAARLAVTSGSPYTPRRSSRSW
jgi:hypothetical protein